jgi:lipoprotein NlpD
VKAIFAVLALALAAGCSPGRWQAPVEDRRPASRAAAKPPAKAPAKAPAPAAVPSSPSAPEGFYTVQKGDTLYSIALEHGQDYREVAQWNSLDDPGKIRVGQVLRVTAPEQAVVLGSGRQGGRVESRPLGSPEQKPVARAEPKEQPKLEAGPLTFAWPVKGKLVAGFAEPRQKGIDIEGRAGDAVTASAAGRVTYVGTGIPGLGKLVVIKHDQGYITVYAHNKDILVKEQQAVARGQKIAALGEKLHFQIRKGAAAVDPMRYLPKS